MIVEELVSKLGLDVDTAAWARGFAMIDKLGLTLLGVGSALGAAAAGVAGLAISTAFAGDEAAATAEKLGITTDALQSLEYAASLSDSTAESLQAALKFVGKNAVEAANGSTELAAAFAKVGVSGADLKGLSADQQLLRISDAFKAMPAGVEKTNLAMKLFGRQGLEMIPLLNKGSDAIAQLQEQARTVGYVMSGETVAASQEFDDAVKSLTGSMTGLRNVSAPMIPFLTMLVRGMARGAQLAGGAMQKAIRAFGVALVWAGEQAVRFKNTLIVLAVLGIGALIGALGAMQISLTGIAVTLALDIGSMIAFGAIATATALKTAAVWALMNAPIILTGVLMLALAAIIFFVYDELLHFASGGQTVMDRFAAYLWQTFPAFFNWFGDKFDWIAGKLSWIADKARAVFSTIGGVLGTQVGTSNLVERDNVNAITAGYGPGSMSPGAAVSRSPVANQSSTASTNFQVQQTINAAPGMSAREVGNASSQALEDFATKQNRAALMSVAR